MLKCPNCKGSLGFWNLLSLNPRKSIINCKHCNANLKAEVDYLYHKTFFIAILAIAGMRVSKSLKDSGSSIHNFVFILSIVLFLIGLICFVKNLKFEVHSVGKEKLEEHYRAKRTEKEIQEFRLQVENFKEQYARKTKIELEEIANSYGWQEAAQTAAKELLLEIENVT